MIISILKIPSYDLLQNIIRTLYILILSIWFIQHGIWFSTIWHSNPVWLFEAVQKNFYYVICPHYANFSDIFVGYKWHAFFPQFFSYNQGSNHLIYVIVFSLYFISTVKIQLKNCIFTIFYFHYEDKMEIQYSESTIMKVQYCISTIVLSLYCISILSS